MDGVPALDQWDLVTCVLHQSVREHSLRSTAQHRAICCIKRVRNSPKIERNKKRLTLEGMMVEEIDDVSPNAKQPRDAASMYIFDDSEAVIRMIIQGRRPTTRHVSRTHRVAFDWWLDRVNPDPIDQREDCRHPKPMS